MKLEREKPSNNVQIDCIGLTVDAEGDTGQAALRCQDEINSLRNDYLTSRSSPGDAANRESAFAKFQGAFIMEQSSGLELSLGEPSAQDLSSRLQDFKERLPEYIAEEIELANIFDPPAAQKDK